MSYTSWDEQFNILKQFYDKNGHCKIPKKNEQYNWVCRQRMNKKDGILSLDKEELLLSIDFKFNESWEEMFDKFIVYFNKYKSIDISQDNEFYNELGSWLKRQIKFIKNNQLPKDKIQKYNNLGLNFNKKKSLYDIWFESYTNLKNYYLLNGNCKVPNTNEYKSLYRFIQTQRDNYKNNKLSEDKITLLREIEFTFDLWEDNYNIAKSYYLKYNSLFIDSSNDEFASLRNWIYNTRQHYKNNKLTNTQIALLKEIDFPFEVISCDKQWLNYCSKYKKFYQSNKDYSAFSSDSYKGLFEWMLEQSKLYNTNKLNSYKLNLLNKINFDFSIYKYYGVDKEWLKSYFKLLKALKDKSLYSVDNLHSKYIEDIIVNQFKNKSSLNNKEIILLKELDSNFNLREELDIDYEWLINFTLVNMIKDSEPTDILINNSIDFVKWIYEQYQPYSNSTLPSYKMKLLKSVKFNKFKRIYLQIDIEWITSYKKLSDFYKNTNKDNEILFKCYEDLFKWAVNQARLFNSTKLSKIKTKLLESINFDFGIYKYYGINKEWLEPYFEINKTLKDNKFYSKDGITNKYEAWIIEQFRNKRQARSRFSNKKALLLKELDSNFNLEEKLNIDYEWLMNFILIKNTKDLEMHEVLIKCNLNSFRWIYEQYPLYNKGLLLNYKIELLKSINFDRFENIYKNITIEWISFYKRIYLFYKANKSYDINPFEYSQELFEWTLKQTKLFNNDKLLKLKVNLLEAIYFDFNTKPISKDEVQWLKYYNKLRTFRKNYGHFMVDDYGAFKNLHKWVKKQENDHIDGLLRIEYYNLLNKIGFEFNNSWENMFRRFNIYYELYNRSTDIHANKHLQYKEIEVWLKEQVKLFKNNKLPNQIIEKYSDIGIDLSLVC